MRSLGLNTLLVMSTLLLFQSITSQDTKQEKESSIKIEQFPGSVPEKIDNLQLDLKREKFYKQKDGEETSCEMKFRHNSFDYSVEVDTLGQLIDIEIEIKKNKIAEKLIKKIKRNFERNFDRYKIEKIQAQFRKNERSTQKLIEKTLLNPLALPDYYEIIVAVKDDEGFKRFEYLFTTDGQVEKKRKVIRNEFNYLIF